MFMSLLFLAAAIVVPVVGSGLYLRKTRYGQLLVLSGLLTLLPAGVSGAALGKVKAGDVLADVARQAGGKGGGRPDMAQGGGDDGPALEAALAGVVRWVADRA